MDLSSKDKKIPQAYKNATNNLKKIGAWEL
jgi:hypothetical protein